MFTRFIRAAFFTAFISQVAGHTGVTDIEIGGSTYKGWYAESIAAGTLPSGSPAWKTNQGWGWQPIYGNETATPEIIAHRDAQPSPNTVKAAAGSDVTFTWFHKGLCKIDNPQGPAEQGWDCSHHGWTATWLAPCPGDDCTKADKTQLEFFKIHESAILGYPAGTRYAEGQARGQLGKWGTDVIFYDNGNKQTVTLPSKIPSGKYVLRTEVASIHNNGPVSQRQIWPQAFNVEITGGEEGAAVPEGVKGTEIYKQTDQLLTMDLYNHEPGLIIAAAPGPKLADVAVKAGGMRMRTRYASRFAA